MKKGLVFHRAVTAGIVAVCAWLFVSILLFGCCRQYDGQSQKADGTDTQSTARRIAQLRMDMDYLRMMRDSNAAVALARSAIDESSFSVFKLPWPDQQVCPNDSSKLYRLCDESDDFLCGKCMVVYECNDDSCWRKWTLPKPTDAIYQSWMFHDTSKADESVFWKKAQATPNQNVKMWLDSSDPYRDTVMMCPMCDGRCIPNESLRFSQTLANCLDGCCNTSTYNATCRTTRKEFYFGLNECMTYRFVKKGGK